MAPTPAKAPNPVSDIMIPAKPFAQSIHPLLRTKPLPEKPPTNAMLFYEDQCETLLVRLYDNTRSPSERIKDALSISALLLRIRNEDLAEECAVTLMEMMQEDSEHPSVRMVCAVAIGSSGIENLATIMERILKSDSSVSSKLLALKALSICRSDEAIELLAMVAQHGDVDELCFAAAKELAGIPLHQARKIVRQVLSHPPEAYMRRPEFAAELRKIVSECYLPTN